MDMRSPDHKLSPTFLSLDKRVHWDNLYIRKVDSFIIISSIHYFQFNGNSFQSIMSIPAYVTKCYLWKPVRPVIRALSTAKQRTLKHVQWQKHSLLSSVLLCGLAFHPILDILLNRLETVRTQRNPKPLSASCRQRRWNVVFVLCWGLVLMYAVTPAAICFTIFSMRDG